MVFLGNVNLAKENHNLGIVHPVITCRFHMHVFHIETLLQEPLDSFQTSSLASPFHVVFAVDGVLQDQATELFVENPYEAFKKS